MKGRMEKKWCLGRRAGREKLFRGEEKKGCSRREKCLGKEGRYGVWEKRERRERMFRKVGRRNGCLRKERRKRKAV